MSYGPMLIQIQDCRSGQGLAFCSINTNRGEFTTADANGFVHVQVAYPGYRLNASAGRHAPGSHTVTEQEVVSGSAYFCLEPTTTGEGPYGPGVEGLW